MSSIKYSKELLQDAVSNSKSIMGVLRFLGLKQAGGTHSHISALVSKYEIDISHFTGRAWNQGKPAFNRRTTESILVLMEEGSSKEKTHLLRRALVDVGVPLRCSLCGLEGEWNSMPITLEIDHINGNWLDNQINNLRFLCPNCHSQQSTSNMPNKHRKV
jgi:hypothetical protein